MAINKIIFFSFVFLAIATGSTARFISSNADTYSKNLSLSHLNAAPELPQVLPPQINPALLTYKFAFYWPKGLCKTKSSGCKDDVAVPEFFTIHGWWPIYKDNSYPDSKEKYDNKIVEKVQHINEFWPRINSYNKPATYKISWKHEWDRHGVRAKLYGLGEYFEHTIELFKASHITDTVKNVGKPTTPKAMRDAFPGRQPLVLCKKGDDGVSYLFSLEFCLDSAENYVNCEPDPQCPEEEDFSYGE